MDDPLGLSARAGVTFEGGSRPFVCLTVELYAVCTYNATTISALLVAKHVDAVYHWGGGRTMQKQPPGRKQSMTIRLSDEARRILGVVSQRKGISRTAVMEIAIRD